MSGAGLQILVVDDDDEIRSLLQVDDPTQIQKAMLDLDAMDKLVEDALLVAVHANPLKTREAVELFALVAEEVEVARMAGGDVALERDGAVPFFVAGDRSALSRALSNIVGNALWYGKAAHVTVRSQGDTAEVVVDDEGPGIRPDQREAVFRAFHRAESSRNRSTGGTGLGLAIALSIIERQHHGGIAIDSAPGGGARFKIRLPRINAGKARPPQLPNA